MPARAEDAADFYRGKQIRLLLGFGAGGADDAYARLLARHMPKHLPGEPLILPQNQPGAGSLSAINALYNTAPRDGTMFGMGHRFVPLMPLLGLEGVKFDPQKFLYLGSMNREIGVCIATTGSGIASVADMQRHEFLVGTTGAGAELTTFYGTISNMLGAKLRIVKGYQTSLEVDLAMEKSEIQGRCGASYSSLKNTKPEWLAEKTVQVFLQIGLSKDAELPHVPLLIDFVSNRDDHQALELLLVPAEMGRPFMAPPGLPPDRLALLRAAFDATMKDPELIEDAHRQRLDISPISGEEMQRRVARAYETPAPIVARAKALVASGEN